MTIEWIRTLVLGVGCLLVVALIGFLVLGKWRSRLNLREIPKRLGVNIQQEANGVTYTQTNRGHTLFKIHASKVVQLKEGGKALLHDVQIELYGDDGSRVDRIAGDEFEYDQKNGKAVAAGPVEITLMRPGQAPAVAPGADAGRVMPQRGKGSALANAAQTAAQGEIHVKTSGLTFDQKSGVASTADRVDFSIQQGRGSSIGAVFDSEKGLLVLDHAVDLQIRRGSDNMTVLAQHAEFERGDLICRMRSARVAFRGGEAAAGNATLLFRSDGSAVRLDANDGFTLRTANAALLEAPRGALDLNEHNQPRQGRLEGGATLESDNGQRRLRAASPTADLAFNSTGELQHAHLERGVTMHSETVSMAQDQPGKTMRVVRDWSSPIADLDFRSVGKGRVNLATVRGTGGVVVTGQSQVASGPGMPSRLAAETVTGSFGEGQELTALTCVGGASLEQVNAAGARQTIHGDRINATLAGAPAGAVSVGAASGPGSGAGSHNRGGVSAAAGAGAQIQAATVEGNVSLVQEPAKTAPGSGDRGQSDPDHTGKQAGAPPVLHAVAGQAVYDGSAGWIHLTVQPRVEDGQLQLSAEAVDVSRESGDAFARGNVKATWLAGEGNPSRADGPSVSAVRNVGLGGQGPAHVIANEARLNHTTGEVTFRGNVRLWQESNSIVAPVVVLDRTRQTLVARGDGEANPVRLVVLSAGGPKDGPTSGSSKPGTSRTPSVIRVRGGDLKYSDAERKAVMHGGSAGSVEAEAGNAKSQSATVELLLLPLHNHAAEDGSAAQVDRVVAAGHVSVSSLGRRGIGDKLVYSSSSGEYVLTGTAANPPRMTEPGRGTVSGDALIFNSRDGSVSIEGDGNKTTTETSAPK